MYKNLDTTADGLQPWKVMRGADLRASTLASEGPGTLLYERQARLLSTLLGAEQRRLGRTLDLLDFGCGFGRLAAPLAAIPGVRYHGFDLSEAMTEPLRSAPPEQVAPVAERVLHGDSPRVALAGRAFDCIVSVSVLGYSPSARIPELLEELGALLRPGGLLVLLENTLVPVSVWDATARPGRWLHAFASLLPDGWDLHHATGMVQGQDLYVLARNEGHARRYFQLVDLEDPRDASRPLAFRALHEAALTRLQEWAEQASELLARPEDARVAELSRRLSEETERFARRQRLHALADDLARFRGPRAPPPEVKPPDAPSAPPAPAIEADAPLDTRWSHEVPRFAGVLHVFHQDWHGIRAAAGYLPGRKLAIPSERTLTRQELRDALDSVDAWLCHTVIVHGFSATARQLVEVLRKGHGTSLRLLALWHGSTAQFPNTLELDLFAQLVELRRKGGLDGLASVKPGLHLLAAELFPRTVLNLPPRLSDRERVQGASVSRAALIPTPNDWRKNFYTNLFAGLASDRLDTLHVTATYRMPEALRGHKRILGVPRPERAALFDLARRCDLILNASLSECQPMTALEGLALRVPCVTGELGLGALDAHPYQRLAQVVHVDSVERVRDAIDRMLERRERAPAELTEMMADYERALVTEALRVLEEFIQS